jgi:ribosome-binding protein aMBF1 (putative translation factor)
LTMQREAPDPAPGELVEAQLDTLIEKRAAQGVPDAEAALAELWARSVERHNRAMRQRQLWDKLRHHQAMIHAHARNAAALVERHQKELERCEQALGIEARGRGC